MAGYVHQQVRVSHTFSEQVFLLFFFLYCGASDQRASTLLPTIKLLSLCKVHFEPNVTFVFRQDIRNSQCQKMGRQQ